MIHGAFSDAGVDERLLIGAIGRVEEFDFGMAYLHGVIDQQGRMWLQWLSDRSFTPGELSPSEDGVDQPVYKMSGPRSSCGRHEATTMRYDPTTHQFHSSRFENLEVELGYYNHSRDVSKGIHFRFSTENLPNQKQKTQIFDTAQRAGLNQSGAIFTLSDLEYWGFDYPYWRFDYDVVPVCQQFPEEIQKLWEVCGSNTRIAWPSDC